MTTYNTGNPLGSSAAKDLYDNAENLDSAVNGVLWRWRDRFGRERASVTGAVTLMELATSRSRDEVARTLADLERASAELMQETSNQASALIAALGYQVPMDYSGGILIDSVNATVSFNGHVFAPIADAVPFVTDEVFEPAQWRVVQGVTAGDLASSQGSMMVGFQQAGLGANPRLLSDKAKEHISPEDFGAIGDGVAHALSERYSTLEEAQAKFPFCESLEQLIDWAALTAAIMTGKTVIGDPAAHYVVGQSVKIVDSDALFNGRNCMITCVNGQSSTFELVATYGDQVLVHSLDDVSVDYTKGQPGGLTNTIGLAVSSTLGFNAGDIVKIVSDDLIEESRPQDRQRKGEHAAVGSLENGRINLYSYPFEKYVSNVRVARMNTDMIVDICSFRSDFVEKGSRPVVLVQGVLAPYVHDVRAARSKAAIIHFYSCLFPRSRDIVSSNGDTDTDTSTYSYVVAEYGCEFGSHSNLFGFQIRHVYTDGTLPSVDGDLEPHRHGRTKGTTISDSVGWSCQNAAFDTHWVSHGIQFQGCRGYLPFNGPNSSQRNFQLRGRNAIVQNCTSYGGVGVHVFQGVDHALSCQGNKIVNFTHFALNKDQSRAAVKVDGFSGVQATIPTVYIDGLMIEQNSESTYPHVEVARGIAHIRNVQIVASQGGSYVASVFLADASGQIYVDGGLVDARGATGIGLRLVKQGPNSRVSLKNLRVLGQYTHLCDGQGNNDVTFDCDEITLDRALLSPAGYTNTISANIRVGYQVGFRRTNRSIFSQVYSAAGDKVLQLERRGGRTLYFSATVSAASGVTRISAIDAGSMDGQELVIRNSGSSAAILRVAANAAIGIGTDRDLAAGSLLRLIYSDAAAAWLPA